MFQGKCPLCGTGGRKWTEPEIFRCPNCLSIFSDFGVVLEAKKSDYDTMSFWS